MEDTGIRPYTSVWESFFDDFKNKGLNGVEMVISDGNKGIREVVKQSFPGSSWQYCHVYFMRNLKKLMGKQQWRDIPLIFNIIVFVIINIADRSFIHIIWYYCAIIRINKIAHNVMLPILT